MLENVTSSLANTAVPALNELEGEVKLKLGSPNSSNLISFSTEQSFEFIIFKIADSLGV